VAINVADCFLCASLQCLYWPQFPLTSLLLSQLPLPCETPHAPLPCHRCLWAPDSTQHPPPTHTCYTPLLASQSNLSLSCHTNLTVTKQLASPSGLYFWCHNTLHSCITQVTPGPCILVIIVPQLTLYGEAEFSLLFGTQPKHTAFLPIMVDMFGNLHCHLRPCGRSKGL
jgi:hypothetical protein